MNKQRKRKCPQCMISAFFIKNDAGDRRLVYVLEDGSIIDKYGEESLDGVDLSEGFCLGCSWHGSEKRLKR